MLCRYIWIGLLAGLGLAGAASAQPVPPPPPPPVLPGAVPPSGAPLGVAGTTTAAPGNLWSFICMTPEQKMACKTCFCNSALGKITSSFASPLSLATGGLVQNRCLQNQILQDLTRPPDSAQGAAARIKQDEAEARARREAVRYLGTVDCNYWPEAQDALINALRGDRNECVRFEAALALQRGCCCTSKVIEALNNTVIGSDRDGFPVENSERVRAAAAEALARCVAHCNGGEPLEEFPPSINEPPIREKEKEKEPEIFKPKARLNSQDYYRRVGDLPRSQVLESAKNTLNRITPPAAAGSLPQDEPRTGKQVPGTLTSQSNSRAHNVGQIFGNAFKSSSPADAPKAMPQAPQETGVIQAIPPVPPQTPAPAGRSFNDPVIPPTSQAPAGEKKLDSRSEGKKASLLSLLRGSKASAPATASSLPLPTSGQGSQEPFPTAGSTLPTAGVLPASTPASPASTAAPRSEPSLILGGNPIIRSRPATTQEPAGAPAFVPNP